MDEYYFRLDNVKLDPLGRLDYLEETGNMDHQDLQDVMVMDNLDEMVYQEEMACLAYMVLSERKVRSVSKARQDLWERDKKETPVRLV